MWRKKIGYSLIELMMILVIIGLLVSIAIPNIQRAKVLASDSMAQSTLKAMSTAAENYAHENEGDYPLEITSLTGSTPPYIRKAYCDEIHYGVTFWCVLGGNGYLIQAHPFTSGATTFTITTGGVLQ